MTTTTFTDNRTTTNTQETTKVISSKDTFIFASEVSERLSVSRAYGYRIVKKLNEELKEQGYVCIYPEEWEYDKEDIKGNTAFCYVKNLDVDYNSEFGSIGFKSCIGGLVRTA